VKRPYGTGHLYEKSGAYYGRWRTPDGRRLNRRIGSVRAPGDSDGITRAQAERMFRNVQADEATTSRAKAKRKRAVTVDFAANALRERLAIEGARLSYRQNTQSMQRIHVSPALGNCRIETITRQDVERLARSMLARGLAPKTVRNIMSFLHAVFALAVANEWIERNPVASRATRGAQLGEGVDGRISRRARREQKLAQGARWAAADAGSRGPAYSSKRRAITAIMAGSISAISSGSTASAESAPSQNGTSSAKAKTNIAAAISPQRSQLWPR
jgi:hypothetical protein